MTDLNLIIDTMLPGDPELEMPRASNIGFLTYLKQHHAVSVSLDFIELLDKVCAEKYASKFELMNESLRLQAINACKLANVRLFSNMVTHLLKAYYTAPTVLAKIGAGSVPPFPSGNVIEHDDWSILEPVYERGSLYRNNVVY